MRAYVATTTAPAADEGATFGFNYGLVELNGGVIDGTNTVLTQTVTLPILAADNPYKIHAATPTNRINISTATPTTLLFLKLSRLTGDAGDTYGKTMSLVTFEITYYTWQNGGFYK